MAKSKCLISVDDFIKQTEVINCLNQLHEQFGKEGEQLKVSDVLDDKGHQYVHLVQKGGGVLGIALVGYTYILEQMNIRFIRLAGTSAGAINTALMTVIGGEIIEKEDINGKINKIVKGDKTIAKSEEILKVICNLHFFDLVDGHPVIKKLIKNFITNKDFSLIIKSWITWMFIILIGLPVIDFICFGLQHYFQLVSYFTKGFFILTGFYILVVALILSYINYLLRRLKDSGFGINPGDFFYNWIKLRLQENNVYTVSDLINKASTPVPGIFLREENKEGTKDLDGDVTFITSELVSQNKIEFPKMWYLFRHDMNLLQPAGFIRASMSIPIFFESYFINDIPCTSDFIKKGWEALGEPDPPSTARFVDGGILSNFPINLFYNANVIIPRLPSFGIDLDDTRDPKKEFKPTDQPINGNKVIDPGNSFNKYETDDEGKGASKWTFGGYIFRLFNTVRFYYDKDFLIKNAFFKKGIGVIPLKGYGWLNFALSDDEKKQMFIIGAKAATKFLSNFNWEEYKHGRAEMQQNLINLKSPNP